MTEREALCQNVKCGIWPSNGWPDQVAGRRHLRHANWELQINPDPSFIADKHTCTFPCWCCFFFILFERRRQEEFALREMKPTVGGRGATSLHRAAPFNFNIDLFNLFVLSKVDQIVVYSDWIAKQVPNFKLNIDNQICRCRYSASIQLQLKHSNTHSKRITQIVIK